MTRELVPVRGGGALLEEGLRSIRLAPLTLEAYSRDLRLYLGHLHAAGVDPRAATVLDVEGFLRALHDGSLDGRRRAPPTVNRALAAVRRAYKLVCQRVPGWDHNPARDVEGFRVDREPQPRARDATTLAALLSGRIQSPQERRYRAASGRAAPGVVRDLAIIALLGVGGLRREEVANLRWPEGVLQLPEGLGLRFPRKGGKWGNLGLGELASRTLGAWLRVRGDAPGFVFPASGGDPQARMALSSINRILAKRSELAGIDPPVTPHDLRHSFVTLALDAGVSLRDVQHAVSHTDPRTTQRYDAQRVALQARASDAVSRAVRPRDGGPGRDEGAGSGPGRDGGTLENP